MNDPQKLADLLRVDAALDVIRQSKKISRKTRSTSLNSWRRQGPSNKSISTCQCRGRRTPSDSIKKIKNDEWHRRPTTSNQTTSTNITSSHLIPVITKGLDTRTSNSTTGAIENMRSSQRKPTKIQDRW